MPAPSSWEGVTGHLEVRKERGRRGGEELAKACLQILFHLQMISIHNYLGSHLIR